MKKVLITRYGAIGDHIHATHLPRALKEISGFDYVAVEHNVKGKYVWFNNPFVDKRIEFEPTLPPASLWTLGTIRKRWGTMIEQEGFDLHINLQNSLEYGYIAMENQNEYYMSSKKRRQMYGDYNYYDQTSIWAGFPEFVGMKGELYFTKDEENNVIDMYQRKYKDNFVLVLNLSGTSKHKLFYNAESIIKKFLGNHEDAVCITMGDEKTKIHQFDAARVVNLATKCQFRQSMLITKYADCVIGCESGLMVAATLLGAPTVQLMTAASIKNHGGDFDNDRSLQSPCACSPCHKGPYAYIGCPTFDYMNEKYPTCIKFDDDVILNQLERVYADYSNKSASLSTV